MATPADPDPARTAAEQERGGDPEAADDVRDAARRADHLESHRRPAGDTEGIRTDPGDP